MTDLEKAFLEALEEILTLPDQELALKLREYRLKHRSDTPINSDLHIVFDKGDAPNPKS